MHKLTGVFILLAIPAASVPLFDFRLTNSAVTASPGSPAVFSYSTVNLSTAGEILGFSNIAFAAAFAGFGTELDLIDPLLVVNTGQRSTGDLFQVTLLRTVAPSTMLDGTVFLTVQFDDPDGTVNTIAQRFSITAASPAIPEPSAALLTISGAAFLGMLAGRYVRSDSY